MTKKSDLRAEIIDKMLLFSSITRPELVRLTGTRAATVFEVVDELKLLQPQTSVHISQQTPDRFLLAAAKVIRNGYGYPSIFNTDAVVMEQMRVGKSVEDAR